jgi:hypothetical protein
VLIPFSKLARHRRRTAVRALQHTIRQQAAQTGSLLFFTHHLLLDPSEPQRPHPWVDVLFLGTDRFTLWNAEFITPEVARQDMAFMRAFEQIEAKLTAAGEVYQASYARGLPEQRYPCLNGLTFSEAQSAVEQELLATLPLPGESFKTNRKYRYGIGLTAVAQVASFDVAAIEKTILRFREIGEQDS